MTFPAPSWWMRFSCCCLGREPKVASSPTRSFKVFYGSQTGTAQRFATSLAQQLGLDSAAPLESFKANAAPPQFLFIVCASYGSGGPPDNAQRFYDLLDRAKKTWPALKGVQFAVFGCGNSLYMETFNGMAKFVDSKLAQLGARRFLDIVLGDASSDNLNTQYKEWETTILQRLGRIEAPALPQKSPIQQVATVDEAIFQLESIRSLSKTAVHIELMLPPSIASYNSAGTIVLYPRNAREVIQALARRLNYDLSQTAEPPHVTIDEALTNSVDLGVISQILLAGLAPFATDASQASALHHLGTTEGLPEFTQMKEKLTLLGVLETFPSIENIPWKSLVPLLSPTKPRQYTIASSSRVFPRSIHCCITVPDQIVIEERKGTMGTFLKSLVEAENKSTCGISLRGKLQPSSFQVPTDLKAPLIMIAAGSGIAPMRWLWQDRQAQARENRVQVGPTWLFYGCRDDRNWLYKEEIAQLTEINLTTIVAFSQAPDHPKKYVQDVLQEKLASLVEYLDVANVYVCGKTNLARSVSEILRGGRTQLWWDNLVATRRFNQEVFG